MVGIYDYTVILTYMSIASSVTGIMLAMSGNSFMAVICLMLSGLFDMFDGKVARTKKRNTHEISFGIQIDSLADVIGFGVLPCAIGYSIGLTEWYYYPIYVIFILAAVIRLAYFNVLEIENLGKKDVEKGFIGLPTTSVALILPIVYATKNLWPNAFIYVYAAFMFIIGVAFITKFKLKKPSNKVMICFLIIGLVELILILKGLNII